MASFRISFFAAAGLLVGGTSACSDDGDVNPVPDGGVEDGGSVDSGSDAGDAGPPDLGPEDAGRTDGGSQDPAILFRGFEQVGSQRLFLEGRGTTTSTNNPVLFLTFLPGFSTDYWVEPARFLLGPEPGTNPKRALIFADLFAQGRSSIADDDDALITAENQARSLGNVVDHLRDEYFDDDTRFDLVAHGYGALLAALHASERSGDFDKMILVAPYPSNVEGWSEWIENYKTDPRFDGKAFADLEISPRCRGDSEQCEIDKFRIYGLSWICSENQSVFFDIDVRNANRIGQGLIDRYLRNTSYDYDRNLAFIRAETTMITGACDQIPEESFLEYELRIPGLRRIHLDDAGFFPMHEVPETFQRIVKEALNEGDGVP